MKDIVQRFKALANRGYQVHAVFSGDTVECTCIVGGDPNCPHPKYFDPKDGHGFTSVHMDDVPDEVLDKLDDGRSPQAYLDGLFESMEKHASRIEGQPKTKVSSV